MANDTLWNSYDRLSRVFRTARATALVAGVVSAIAWIWPSVALATLASVVAATAVLIALFSWFRADDLSGGPPLR